MLDIIIGLFIRATSKTWVIAVPPYTAEAYYEPTVQQPPTLKEVVEHVSRKENFDSQIVKNVIDTETGGTWDCTLVGKDGELGCLQIIPKFHPNVNPLNFEEAVKYFISEYKSGRGWQWVGCSCMSSARLTVPYLQKGNADDLVPNATMQEGKIAILDYKGIRHAVAYKVVSTGILATKEGNFKPCLIKDRIIPFEELNEVLIGFWSPGGSP